MAVILLPLSSGPMPACKGLAWTEEPPEIRIFAVFLQGIFVFFCDKDEELSNLHSEDDCPGTWVGLLIS